MEETNSILNTLRTEDEILDSWEDVQQSCLLSVMCITYNHVDFIEAAIESFLSQETNFPIEIWIHDDASTDGTRKIIERYQRSYPNIIKTVLQQENQYSQGKRASQILRKKCKGKYIAVCEGDDYWCDNSKLQKQVDYLETHPDVVITGHDAFIIDEKGRKLKGSKLPDAHKRDYSDIELLHGKAWILTMSWVYRNIDIEFSPERLMVRNGDTFFVSILGRFGGSHYHDDIEPAAYRVHDNGIWSRIPEHIKSDDTVNTNFWMYRYYKRLEMKSVAEAYHKKAYVKFSDQFSIGILISYLCRRILGINFFKKIIRKLIGNARTEKLKGLLSR